MAQDQVPIVGQKRGPGRPPKNATPAMKKIRTSLSAPTPPTAPSPTTHSPAVDSPRPEKPVIVLPLKISETKSLPCLSERQAVDLPSQEYQSIAASAVLAASLERSRQRWIGEGIFQRYWVKPETGKHAKPPPPNNPELKWMKMEAPCRIRIEPHIFEVDVYVEKKPRPAPPPMKPLPFAAPAVAYGHQPYQQHQQQQPYPPRTLPPAVPPARPAPAPAPPQDRKASPDPVISMLANRASSDPELKALMKEVATGNANQEQLRVFQQHIDTLTAIIQKQRKDEDARAAQLQQTPANTFYNGPSSQYQQPQQPAPPPQRQYQPPPPPPPPPPTNLPVILAFTNQGASEDRFLFPEHSILEPLSPQHLLVSFIVVRKGHDAADPSGLDPDVEYWQPVTMMVEVAFGREEILAHIRRWVRPQEAVRTHMEDVMKRCRRAPQTHLALRLPVKGSATAAAMALAAESAAVSKEATPVAEQKPKPTVKYVKKAAVAKGPATSAPAPAASTDGPVGDATAAAAPNTAATGDGPAQPPSEADGKATTGGAAAGDKADEHEGARPRRTTRKSVRISEG